VLEVKSHHSVEPGSNRGLGIVFSVVFAIVGLYPLVHGGDIRIWALVIAALFLIVALVAPGLLTVPNRLWTKFGLLLGAIVAPIVMMLVFFVAVTPIGLFMRATGRDLLRQKRDPDAETYWIKREGELSPMRNQF